MECRVVVLFPGRVLVEIGVCATHIGPEGVDCAMVLAVVHGLRKLFDGLAGIESSGEALWSFGDAAESAFDKLDNT